MTSLIGLYSPSMGHGKTALTEVLTGNHGWVSVKFAGTLKSMIRGLLTEGIGLTEEEALRYTDGDRKEAVIPFFGVSCRHMMQTLGTDWGRKLIKPTIWIDVAKAKIQRLLNDGWRVVVDDMRFPNEFDAIKELGGKTVKVVRPGIQDQTGHVSEGALNSHQFDLELINRGSLDEWKEHARGLNARLRADSIQVVS